MPHYVIKLTSTQFASMRGNVMTVEILRRQNNFEQFHSNKKILQTNQFATTLDTREAAPVSHIFQHSTEKNSRQCDNYFPANINRASFLNLPDHRSQACQTTEILQSYDVSAM